MTNEPLHPLPPEVWGEPPASEFDPRYDCAPVSDSPTTGMPTHEPTMAPVEPKK